MTIFHWVANAFLLAVMAVLAWQDWRLQRAGPKRRTVGTVIDHRRTEDDGAYYFSARIRFLSDTGREIVIEDSVGRATPAPAIGSTVTVVYPVANPSRARVRRPGLRLFIYAALWFALALVTSSGMKWI
jgi:hypothetical protein